MKNQRIHFAVFFLLAFCILFTINVIVQMLMLSTTAALALLAKWAGFALLGATLWTAYYSYVGWAKSKRSAEFYSRFTKAKSV